MITSAKCFPDTTPIRADNLCSTKPSTVAHNVTQSNEYWAIAPDCISDSILPGSRYAILTEKIYENIT